MPSSSHAFVCNEVPASLFSLYLIIPTFLSVWQDILALWINQTLWVTYHPFTHLFSPSSQSTFSISTNIYLQLPENTMWHFMCLKIIQSLPSVMALSNQNIMTATSESKCGLFFFFFLIKGMVLMMVSLCPLNICSGRSSKSFPKEFKVSLRVNV